MRLIDADAADIDRIHCYHGGCCYIEDVQEWLDDQPTIEAEPVRHGRWIMVRDRYNQPLGQKCSKCGRRVKNGGENYCPECGAKMDGGDNNGSNS